MECEIIRSNKGGEKLCADGYLYTKKKVGADKIYWRCANRIKFNCAGTAATSLDVSAVRFSVLHRPILLSRSYEINGSTLEVSYRAVYDLKSKLIR